MSENPLPHVDQKNMLGNSSLGLGIASSALVFGIGMCAFVGGQQGWLNVAAAPLLVCGASSAFLGFIGFILGVAGIVSGHRSKATAIVGLILGVLGICLFFGIMAALSQGAG